MTFYDLNVNMRKIFSFKGISRGGDDLLSTGGECLDVVNMRMKDGVLVPVPRPAEVACLDGNYSNIYWHEAASHYICVTDDNDMSVHVYDGDWNAVKGDDGSQRLFKELAGVTAVEFQGFVACCIARTGIFYLLFNDGAYKWLGEGPQMPSLAFTAQSKLQRMITPEKFYTSSAELFGSVWRYNSKGYFDECIATLAKEGYYIDRALFRFALRLFDGSYISVSPVLYISDEERINNVARDADNLRSDAYTAETPTTFDVRVLGFKPEFSFRNVSLDGWENIVMGIDLFTTGSIMGKKSVEVEGMFADGDVGARVYKRYETYRNKELDELCNDILSAGHFYRIAEYDLKGNLIEKLDDVSAASLALQPSLEESGASLKSVSAGCSYMFNNRLHIASLKEWFCKGYPSFFLNCAYGTKEVMECMYARTEIRTSKGTSSVVRRYENVPLVCNDGIYELPPMLSYPDSRAFRMTLFAYVDTELFSKTFELVPHRNLDIALYLNKWHLGLRVSVRASLSNGVTLEDMSDKDVAGMFSCAEGVHTVVYSAAENSWMYNGTAFPTEEYSHLRLVGGAGSLADGDSITFTLTACSDQESYSEIRNIPIDNSWTLLGGAVDETDVEPYEERKNVLKVSPVGNLFSFPAECTYTPSQGEIVALASNTVALSQGEFGRHPLCLFCSDGIWAMSVDASGELAYVASYPLSREVCVNPESVCPVDSGVVFVSKQGVMLASGGKMLSLSESMDGELSTFSSVSSDSVIRKLASMMQMPDALDAHSFRDFILTSRFAYQPSHDEIIAANRRYSFCYVYSMRSRVWSRVMSRVDGFLQRYSSLNAFENRDGVVSVKEFGSCCSGENSVMLLTRPQLWGTKLPKRIVQLMLHACAKPCREKTQWMPVLACYMFGSNDGVHFRLLAGRESESEVQDLKFPYFPTQAYKYYMFAVCGEMSAGSMLTAVELDVQEAWGNRFR